MVKKKEWEDFMAVGRVPSGMRHDILASWKRSVRHAVADRTRAPIVNEDELEGRRMRARRLGSAARNALNRAGSLLIGTRDILLLSDDAGVVIDAVGDPHTLARARENHLHTGGRWIEEAIGTNAIGTALHLGLPTLIQEAEHFCEAIQRWNCAATPITDPATGRILGVIDISWPGEIRQSNALALSSALALQMETELTLMLDHERGVLLEHSHVRRMHHGRGPMLILDRNGANVFATDDLAHMSDDIDLGDLRSRLPSLINQPAGQIGEALAECLPGADVEVITNRDDPIGVLIALRSSRLRAAAARPAGMELSQIASAGDTSAELCAQARRLAETGISILIEGETGTGKSFLAEAIHAASALSNEPFEMIDCARLTEETLRDYVTPDHHRARVGTLCLNSPGATPATLQKLLLTLVEKVVAQGGRIIALSARSLYDEMRENNFRSDLYYRIAGARLHITPLRERPAEIAQLLRQIVRSHAAENGRRELRFLPGAMAVLKSYAWPGNLLEMRNLVTALDALSPTGLIEERTLPREFREPTRRNGRETLRDVERAGILDALEAEDGNLSRVAKRLGIARSTLYLKLDSYGIATRRKT
ncbi:sigma-54-dependent Fis family transcriptional regulator [Martelella soudanensis]|uniref:sigma-54-dependent Fis family transcriptional regulator n=1 Tax=unclassified Martelella TaxID=2629616 RepID=UPI001FEF7058|nr:MULTISPECIES: sigma 54-interacting transcriptional regulator [unclassified Martelella]